MNIDMNALAKAAYAAMHGDECHPGGAIRRLNQDLQALENVAHEMHVTGPNIVQVDSVFKSILRIAYGAGIDMNKILIVSADD